jgi:tetratricopeptide (TPR) repeat protein
MEAYEAGRYATAAALARALVREEPGQAPAWEVLGDSLAKLSRYDEARKALRQALDLTTGERRRLVLADLGHLYEAKGDLRRAGEWFRKAIEADSSHAGPRIYLGTALRKQGRLAEAEAVLREATGCEKGCLDEAWLALGLVLRAEERLGEAMECFARALVLDPEYDAARDALADVMAARRALEEED